MDLDKLLASLQSVVDEQEKSSAFLEVKTYVPSNSKVIDKDKTEAGARLLVASFLYWLITRKHLSVDRKANLNNEIDSVTSNKISPTLVLKNQLADQISWTDVDDSSQQFCCQYLKSSMGGFATDFQALFVDGTELNSFLDVEESWEHFDEIARLMDERFNAFSKNDKNWNSAYQKQKHLPPMQFENAKEWIFAVRTFHDLEETSGGRYKTRLQEYWRVIDAAIEMPTLEVAQELVKTYLHIENSAVLSSSWRILRSFPPLLTFNAILDNIEEITIQTKYASELVDIFDSSLSDTTINEMIELLEHTSVTARRSYVSALESAKISGSIHASKLLKILYPDD